MAAEGEPVHSVSFLGQEGYLEIVHLGFESSEVDVCKNCLNRNEADTRRSGSLTDRREWNPAEYTLAADCVSILEGKIDKPREMCLKVIVSETGLDTRIETTSDVKLCFMLINRILEQDSMYPTKVAGGGSV